MNYNQTDHRHCPATDSPCGIEGEHRCCLCEKPVEVKSPLEVIQEGQKTLNGEFARWQGDIVWHNANILALLQAPALKACRAELDRINNEPDEDIIEVDGKRYQLIE